MESLGVGRVLLLWLTWTDPGLPGAPADGGCVCVKEGADNDGRCVGMIDGRETMQRAAEAEVAAIASTTPLGASLTHVEGGMLGSLMLERARGQGRYAECRKGFGASCSPASGPKRSCDGLLVYY